MKRIYLLMILFVAFAGNAIAQRMIDIEVTMQNPAAGYTIDSGVSFTTNVIVKNVGNVASKPLDSVLYYYSFGGNGLDFTQDGVNNVTIYYKLKALNPNDTIQINRSFSFNYSTPDANDINGDYCVIATIVNRSADSARDNVTGNNSGCKAVKMKANYNGVNVESITASDDVSKVNQVYPNPAANSSTIDLSLTHSHNVVIRVMDLQGRTVISNDRGKMEAGNYLLRLDTYTLQNGIYLYQVNIDGNVQTGKLTIAK